MIFKATLFLFLLLLLPIIYKLLIHAQRRNLDAFKRLRGAIGNTEISRRKTILRVAALGSLIVALARPVWNPHPVPATLQGRDLVIALDISRSMLAADIYPDRLESARFVLLETLPSLRGQRLALITFAGSASVRVPLTLDHNFMRYVLERIQTSDAEVGSTSLQAAIEKTLDIVLSESERGRQDMIILTDGEDHISDVDKVADQLREWGARVLIIGIGDPVQGAPLPAIDAGQGWMRYKGEEVISRLDESTLKRLADASPGIVYYPARTAAFDLLKLYNELLAETAELKVGDEVGNEFDEGYQYFIALGIVLLLLAAGGRVTTTAVLCLLLVGCDSRRKMREPPAEYHQRMQTGINDWSVLQSMVADNPALALTMLDGAREEFLQAAMLSSGDMRAARYITGVSAQMRAVEEKVRELQQKERQIEQSIEQLVKQLRELTLREEKLARDARIMLRAYPPPKEDEKIARASVAAAEQQPITEGTAEVVGGIDALRERVRQIIGGAFEHADSDAVTEFDEVAELLKSAAGSQKEIAEQLALQQPALNKAADALVVAARAMRQSLELLSEAQKQDDSGDQDQSEMDEWEFEEDVDWSESSDEASMSMPIRSSTFNSALNNRDIPVPNYTAEEILAEEQKNLSERSRKKESRAGARVEKNW